MRLLTEQIAAFVGERRALVREAKVPAMTQVLQLVQLQGVGINSAWLHTMELFGWRKFRSGREIGSLAGLTPTPHQSGALRQELGIDKAGNKRVRWMAIEGAWAWLRFQPESVLSRWYVGALRTRRTPDAEDWHRRAGAEAPDRPLALPRNRRAARGRETEGARADLSPLEPPLQAGARGSSTPPGPSKTAS